MVITLSVYGQPRSFGEDELRLILEKHFAEEKEPEDIEEEFKPKVPIEGEWFLVDPLGINQRLFKNRRGDHAEEQLRQLIREAFTELNKKPEKYAKAFETMMPVKTWTEKKSVEELKALASQIGDHNADWVELALEWAYRIQSGESWKSFCHEGDTANWYRIVIWKKGDVWSVGGARQRYRTYAESYVRNEIYYNDCILQYSVPLVVRYK